MMWLDIAGIAHGAICKSRHGDGGTKAMTYDTGFRGAALGTDEVCNQTAGRKFRIGGSQQRADPVPQDQVCRLAHLLRQSGMAEAGNEIAEIIGQWRRQTVVHES